MNILSLFGRFGALLFIVVAASIGFEFANLPAPVLFGALVGGVIISLTWQRPPRIPSVFFIGGQGLIGATIGTMVSVSTLRTLGGEWLSILLLIVGTLLVSIMAGQILGLHRNVSVRTGTFALIAGGASGITSIARELGADERVVAIVQYLRVLLILLIMPLVTTLVFRADLDRASSSIAQPSGHLVGGAVFAVVCVVVGLVFAKSIRFPAGPLLGPMVMAMVISLTGFAEGVGVPVFLVDVGYGLVGVQIGLQFTRESLSSIASILPLATGLIFGVIGICAGMGAVLASLTDIGQLDAYLATTPGGLYAVLATAADSGSNVTFVLTVQIVRVFVMLLFAPILANLLRRFDR